MGQSEEIDFARLDLQRSSRIGIAEAVYAPGKTPVQCVSIILEMLDQAGPGPVILSRPDEAQLSAVLQSCPAGAQRERLVFWNQLKTKLAHQNHHAHPHTAPVVIATAGTGDLPTAKECAGVLEAYGVAAEIVGDVGVAGIHRTLAITDCLKQAQVVVVVAGMEGALASVIGGLTPAPIVAIPSSVGYGTSLEGITALLSMMSSCSPGITAVGIDNGFGAACAVLRILNHVALPDACSAPTQTAAV